MQRVCVATQNFCATKISFIFVTAYAYHKWQYNTMHCMQLPTNSKILPLDKTLKNKPH